MSEANPLWGAPRIHGEILKLGIDVCQATARRAVPFRRARHGIRGGEGHREASV